MEAVNYHILFLAVVLFGAAVWPARGQSLEACWNHTGLSPSDFGPDFYFGVATSATQSEGAAAEDGKGPSIWDKFALLDGKIADGSTPDVTDDLYHKYKDDIAMIKQLGFQHYRMSLSWSRIIPDGNGAVNPLGVQFYQSLFQELQQAGIQPMVTLYHWDLPNALDEQFGGLLNDSFSEMFTNYADLCFQLFGDSVKLWTTFNEPQESSIQGYGTGGMAPGRCSNRASCAFGNSSVEPYIVGHNILKAHAATAQLYKSKYQAEQQGRIGITLDSQYFYPVDTSQVNTTAANRGMEFSFGWYADPIIFGDYPQSMKDLVGSRLPQFTDDEKAALRGSADFLGLNYYTSRYAWQAQPSAPGTPWDDNQVATTDVSPTTGQLIGAQTASPWLLVVPSGMRDMLLWIESRYGNIPIFVTETGCSDAGASTLQEALCDTQRVQFYNNYLAYLLQAKRAGVNVQGFMAWSLFDNWEWARGFTERFGIVHVDFTDPTRPRNPKASALWWQSFLNSSQ